MSDPNTITVYDEVTGEALYSCQRPAHELEPGMIGAGRAIYNGFVDGATHWINPETKRPNQRRDIGVRAAKNRVTGIPDGAKVMVAGTLVEPENGEVQIAVDWPETVEVIIDGPRLKRRSLTVECEPDGVAVKADATIAMSQDVAALRRKEYPSIGDQLDDIWKALSAPGIRELLPESTKVMLDTVTGVKASFPKKG